MPKRRRRSFTPQFKAQVVLEVLAGLKNPSEIARKHKLKPELIARWKDIALEGLESLHSDQGVQYAATAYTDLLAGRGVAISMAAVGKPEENGYAERLMRTIREEEIDLSEYRDFADAYGQLGRFLDDV